MAAMAIELCLIGILNPWTHIKAVGWVQAILTLVWTFTFQLSAGQLGIFYHYCSHSRLTKVRMGSSR